MSLSANTSSQSVENAIETDESGLDFSQWEFDTSPPTSNHRHVAENIVSFPNGGVRRQAILIGKGVSQTAESKGNVGNGIVAGDGNMIVNNSVLQYSGGLIGTNCTNSVSSTGKGTMTVKCRWRRSHSTRHGKRLRIQLFGSHRHWQSQRPGDFGTRRPRRWIVKRCL